MNIGVTTASTNVSLVASADSLFLWNNATSSSMGKSIPWSLQTALYTRRDVKIYGDGGTSTGLVYRNAVCPTVTNYTPVGLAGWSCSGASEFGLNMFDIYIDNGRAYVNYKGSISASAYINVRVLYIRTS